MLLLSNFIATKTLAWTSIHSWVTNSTCEELLYRIIFYANDVYYLNYIHQNDPHRARTIARSKASLSSLVGHNVQLISDSSIDCRLFLHQQNDLMPKWRQTALAFKRINHNMKTFKYNASNESDPFFTTEPNPAKEISRAKDIYVFEGHELHRAFMPMPTLAILVPFFRQVI